MMNFTSHLISFFVVFPVFVFFFVFIISKMITRKQRYSIHMAIDISTFFFMLSVHFVIKELWNVSLLPYIFIFLLLIGMIFAFIHYKMKDDIHFMKILKGIWRLSFLIFFPLYIVLMGYGLITSMLESFGMN